MKIIPNFISSHLPVYIPPEGRMCVVRDWFILVTVSVLIITVEIVWSIFFFRDNIVIHAPVHMTVVNVAKIDTSAMQRVQDIFSKRASMQSSYESNAVPVADPSK